MKLELGLLAAIQAGLVALAGWMLKDMKQKIDTIEKDYMSKEDVRREIELELRSLRVTNEDIKEDIREIKSDVKEMLKTHSSSVSSQ